jgi:hypothetical protein
MNARFLSALAFLLAFAVQGVRAQSFPEGDVFTPLVADPVETRNFLSVLSVDADPVQSTFGSVGLGANFGLYRWPGQQPGDGWQVGLFAAINSLFDLEGTSYPLVNTDFRIGVPVSFRHGAFSGRARLFHQSSHLGDELILQGNAPQRLNVSVEIVDFVLAWEHAGWRPYAGAGYVVHGDPSDLKSVGVQVGIDYIGSTRALFGGRLVGGFDYKSFEETDWRAGMSAKIGLQYGRPYPDRRGLTVLLEAFDGPAPYGQFYRDTITQYGVALQFDY